MLQTLALQAVLARNQGAEQGQQGTGREERPLRHGIGKVRTEPEYRQQHRHVGHDRITDGTGQEEVHRQRHEHPVQAGSPEQDRTERGADDIQHHQSFAGEFCLAGTPAVDHHA